MILRFVKFGCNFESFAKMTIRFDYKKFVARKSKKNITVSEKSVRGTETETARKVALSLSPETCDSSLKH